MITHAPHRLSDIGLACYFGVPANVAAVSPRPILNALPVRCLQPVLWGSQLYAAVAYAFTVDQ